MAELPALVLVEPMLLVWSWRRAIMLLTPRLRAAASDLSLASLVLASESAAILA